MFIIIISIIFFIFIKILLIAPLCQNELIKMKDWLQPVSKVHEGLLPTLRGMQKLPSYLNILVFPIVIVWWFQREKMQQLFHLGTAVKSPQQ